MDIQTDICDTFALGHDQLLSYVALYFESDTRSITYERCELELVGPFCLELDLADLHGLLVLGEPQRDRFALLVGPAIVREKVELQCHGPEQLGRGTAVVVRLDLCTCRPSPCAGQYSSGP